MLFISFSAFSQTVAFTVADVTDSEATGIDAVNQSNYNSGYQMTEAEINDALMPYFPNAQRRSDVTRKLFLAGLGAGGSQMIRCRQCMLEDPEFMGPLFWLFGSTCPSCESGWKAIGS